MHSEIPRFLLLFAHILNEKKVPLRVCNEMLQAQASFRVPDHRQVDSKRKGTDGTIQTHAIRLMFAFIIC